MKNETLTSLYVNTSIIKANKTALKVREAYITGAADVYWSVETMFRVTGDLEDM